MVKLLLVLSLAFGVSAYGQTCPGALTPNYGLCVPAHGVLNWDTWINPNWAKIDAAIAAAVAGGNPSIIAVTQAPFGACSGSGLPMQYLFSTGVLYACQNSTWGQIGGSVNGELNIVAFGAVSGGPAAANLTAIQAAVNALGPGQCLYRPPGIYSINGTITVNGVNNFCMDGPGQIAQTAVNTNNWLIENLSNFNIDQVWDTGRCGSATDPACSEYANTGNPNHTTNLYEIVNSSGSIHDSVLTNFAVAAVWVEGTSSHVTVNHNRIQGPGSSVTASGPIPAGANGNYGVFANYVSTGGAGLQVTDNDISDVAIGEFISTGWIGNVFTGNRCAPVGEACIYGYPQDMMAGTNTIQAIPSTATLSFVFRHTGATNTAGFNVGPNVSSGTANIAAFTVDAGATSTFANISVHDNICNTCDIGITFDNLTSSAYDFTNAQAINNIMIGATVWSPEYGITIIGGSGKIKGNTISGFQDSCILSQTSVSSEVIEVDGNTTSNCGVGNTGGPSTQSNIYVAGPGKSILDNNKTVAPAGSALYNISANANASIQIGSNNLNLAGLPNSIGSANIIPWPAPAFSEYAIFTLQPENYLEQSYAFTSPWAYGSIGGGSNPTVTPNGATDPLGNTGTVNAMVFNAGGSGGLSALSQTVTGQPSTRTSTLSLWYIEDGTSCKLILEDVGSGYIGNNSVVITTSASWQQVKLPVTYSSGGTSDVWVLENLSGYNATCSALIYGAQLSYSGGQYAQTTSAGIDNTPLYPFVNGFTIGRNIWTASTLPIVGTPTVGHASCILSAGPPVVIGYCSTAVDSSGICTCN